MYVNDKNAIRVPMFFSDLEKSESVKTALYDFETLKMCLSLSKMGSSLYASIHRSCASSKSIPCFSLFDLLLFGSYSNSIIIQYMYKNYTIILIMEF